MEPNKPEVYFAIPLILVAGTRLVLGNRREAKSARSILGPTLFRASGWSLKIGSYYAIPTLTGIGFLVVGILLTVMRIVE